MKFTIEIFGCQMNYADSARIKAVLINCGFSYVPTIDEADIVIFDTCSVRQKSEDKVFGKMKEIPSDKKIWITGCLIQHHLKAGKIAKQSGKTQPASRMTLGNFVGQVKTLEPVMIGWEHEDLDHNSKFKDNDERGFLYVNHSFNPLFYKLKREFDNLELFFRIDDTGFLPLMLKELGYELKHEVDLMNEYSSIVPHSANQIFQENTKTAYVPISTGCNQFCAYCIVPFSRGLEKHRPMDDVLSEIKHHLNQGVEEIVLLGQIVNKHPDFAKILKATLAMTGLRWLRYTSPYPTFYADEVFVYHENEAKLCSHIHMPLQSGSDRVLKKMLRGYNSDEYKKFIDKVRSLKRPMSITSDIIVGFCDETDEDFQASLELAEYARFDMIYIGIYSPRPGTIAAQKYEDNIPKMIKHQRWSTLNDLLTATSITNNQLEVGKKTLMMVTKNEKNIISGYGENMKNIVLYEDLECKPGQFLNVEIITGEPFSLKGVSV